MAREVILLERTEFDKLLKDISDIKDFLQGKKIGDDVEKPISHKEAAAFLRIGRNTLNERIKSGTYPTTIIHWNGPRKVYFKLELKELLK